MNDDALPVPESVPDSVPMSPEPLRYQGRPVWTPGPGPGSTILTSGIARGEVIA